MRTGKRVKLGVDLRQGRAAAMRASGRDHGRLRQRSAVQNFFGFRYVAVSEYRGFATFQLMC